VDVGAESMEDAGDQRRQAPHICRNMGVSLSECYNAVRITFSDKSLYRSQNGASALACPEA
jgi:hypothetical protein